MLYDYSQFVIVSMQRVDRMNRPHPMREQTERMTHYQVMKESCFRRSSLIVDLYFFLLLLLMMMMRILMISRYHYLFWYERLYDCVYGLNEWRMRGRAGLLIVVSQHQMDQVRINHEQRTRRRKKKEDYLEKKHEQMVEHSIDDYS